MINLRSLCVSMLAACSIAPAFAELSTSQIVDSINQLARKSQALQGPAQSITIINGPSIIIGQGPYPQIIAGIQDIVSYGTTFATELQGTKPVSKADADSILDAFRGLAYTHQQFLNILIGKSGLFRQTPFIGKPVAAALRQDENILDTLSFGLIDIAESRSKDLESEADALSKTVSAAIAAHDGTSASKYSLSAPASRVQRVIVEFTA